MYTHTSFVYLFMFIITAKTNSVQSPYNVFSQALFYTCQVMKVQHQ